MEHYATLEGCALMGKRHDQNKEFFKKGDDRQE